MRTSGAGADDQHRREDQTVDGAEVHACSNIDAFQEDAKMAPMERSAHAMMLREGGKANGEQVDVRAITDHAIAARSAIPNAGAMIALADAMVKGNEETLSAAREKVLAETDAVRLVDGVAVASFFERMVRIADGTGIPLDAPVTVMTEDLREDLGVNSFTAAVNTPRSGLLMRLLRPVIVPVMSRALRLLG